MQPPSTIYADRSLEVLKTVTGTMGNNVYVLQCTTTGAAILIDAASEGTELLAWAQELGVTKVLTTHGHHDHVGAVPDFRRAGIPVLVGDADSDRLPTNDGTVSDGDLIELGKLTVEVLGTPGHTPGSICLRPQNKPLVFTGDTLFPGGPGATHFPGGDFDAIIESLEGKLFRPLDDETQVFPGHGPSTTIGTERPSLPAWIARRW